VGLWERVVGEFEDGGEGGEAGGKGGAVVLCFLLDGL